MMKQLKQTVERAMADGLIRGAVVMFGTRRETWVAEAFGLADHQTGRAMARDSVFDMASVTKAVCVGTLLARAADSRKIDLDAPFVAYIPGYRGRPRRIVTVRDLATHYSGLGPERPYDAAMMRGSAALMDAMLDLTPTRPPQEEYLYCCANYILLGMVLEAVNGESLEVQAEREIFAPLGMSRSSWGFPRREVLADMVHPRLVTTHGRPPEAVVPPEIAALDRSDDLPSDETARWALPRRIGNAGLFSCADDLAKFARFLLKKPFGEAGCAAVFGDHAPAGKHPRSVGWDREPTGVFSPETLHHTGWSGQSLWIDPAESVFGMVLTNRCGDHARGKALRLEIMRMAREEIGR
jgi:CubicO group peptidase (beta-lactamase class C family)